jgi:hypothetical protein
MKRMEWPSGFMFKVVDKNKNYIYIASFSDLTGIMGLLNTELNLNEKFFTRGNDPNSIPCSVESISGFIMEFGGDWVPDWRIMDETAKFATRDRNGCWMLFNTKPEKGWLSWLRTSDFAENLHVAPDWEKGEYKMLIMKRP